VTYLTKSVSSDTDLQPDSKSRRVAAEIADVSEATIQRAWEVTKTDPELAKVARENKIAPSTARRALDDAELRKDLLSGGNGRKRATGSEHYKPKEERVAAEMGKLFSPTIQ
jgi:hypothetical protein